MIPATRFAVVAVLVLALLPALVSACPLCKDAKSDADYAGGTASLPHGFNYSIFLMVSAPFVVIGSFILRIVLAQRKLRSDRTPAAALARAHAAPESAGGPPLLPDSPGGRL